MNKATRRDLRDRFSVWALRVTVLIIRFCPLFIIDAVSSVLGTLAYAFVRRQRALVLENLSIAFPSLPRSERKQYARWFFISLVRNPLQTLYALRHPRYLDRVTVEGREYLDEALRLGKGVVAITAHFGNFTLMHLKLAQLGYPLYAMARAVKGERVNVFFQRLREEFGVKTIYAHPRPRAVKETLAVLRMNKIVLILMDQDFRTHGVWVKFFGRLASTAVGPVVLGMRTGAAVVPLYIFPVGRGSHTIKILPPQPMKESQTKEKSILLNTVSLSRIIESWIAVFPDQWGWIHHRWRSQPTDEDYAKGAVEV